ncbi:DUF2280 domain-containing protein [Dongia sedimenti]|uniref:DUF2280 domain-containing protein n=1 Tax=Dongia sedimenti TaxID=3064282 RepID=A0ABU0YIK1_9PROT|nr:DUF2280 domain-containing protein [Rhodospirillaceae bacterium R-7]
MRPLQKMSNPIPSASLSSITDEPALPVLTGRAKDFITARLARGETPARIAAGLRAHFEIEITPAQVIPYWKGELAPPTQTGHRQDDKESEQFPADAAREPLFTRITSDANPEAVQTLFSIAPEPDPVAVGAEEEDAPPTQTGHRQDEEESLQIPLDALAAGAGARSRRDGIEALGALVKAKLGIAPDPAPQTPTTQTGHRQNRKATVLTDEMKTFIVKGLARYETPSRVAASVLAEFGVEIDRRQVFAYDPAGSRPPARRWIALHAATRTKFLRALSEIGTAQKVVRLRMLDRLANRADEANQIDRCARLLEQSAKECGGFYERYQRPKAAA